MSSGFSAEIGFKPRIPSPSSVPGVPSSRFVVRGTPSTTYRGSLPAEMEFPPRIRTIAPAPGCPLDVRSEEHTSELQSRLHLVCRLLLEKKKNKEHKLLILIRTYLCSFL